MIKEFLDKYELRFLLIMIFIGLCYIQVPGRMEAKYFPVLDQMAVNVEVVDDTKTDIYLDFNKLRSECSFRKVEFYLSDTKDGVTASTKLHAQYAGMDTVRFAGVHTGVGPWRVNVPIDQLDNLTVVFMHRCHSGWQAVTTYKLADGKLEKV